MLDLHKYKKKMIDEKSEIPEKLLYKWLYQVMHALNYLHFEKQIIHRDLKPL